MYAASEAIVWISVYEVGLALIFIGLGLILQRLFGSSFLDRNPSIMKPLPRGRGSESALRISAPLTEPRPEGSGFVTLPKTIDGLRLDLDRILAAFWIGFAAAICFLQMWHLFFAVTWRSLAVLTAASVVGLFWNRRALAIYLGTTTRPGVIAASLCCVLSIAWVANNSAGPPVGTDDAVYHIQTVRWNTTYPAVLGLGNLHDRLAFNDSSLLYSAMLEWGPWAARAVHISSGLLVWMLLVRILASVARLVRGSPEDTAPSVFDLVLVTPAIALIISTPIASFAPDVTVAVTVLMMSSSLYRLLVRPKDLDAGYDAAAIVFLAAVSICLKISAIVIAPVYALIALLFVFAHAPIEVFVRATKWALAAAGIALLPWVVHGLMLSGYALYPSTFGGLPVDWKVPAELATAQRLWVLAYARHSMLTGLSWTPAWIGAEMHWRQLLNRAPQWSSGVLGVLIPCAIASACVMLRAFRRRRTDKNSRGYWLILACAFGSVVWFCTAPAPRFGFAIFWSLAAAAAGEAALTLRQSGLRAIALPAAAALALIAVVFPLRAPLLQTAVSRLWVSPGADHGMHPYPVAELYNYGTQSGLTLLVPKQSDSCFNAPLPCTPHPAPNLILSQARDGRPKFVTKGSWQQINWPNFDKPELGADLKARARAELNQ